MLSGALIGLVVGIFVWGVGMLIATTKKAGAIVVSGDAPSCLTMMTPEQALQAIRSAVRPPYTIDETGTTPDQIVLATSPDLSSWGFFFPVQVRPHPQGSTQVVVGCQSRLVQGGPIVQKKHREAVEFVRVAVNGM